MCFICSPSQQSPIHIQDDQTYPTNFQTGSIDRSLKNLPTNAPSPAGKLDEDSNNPGKYKVKFVPECGFTVDLDNQTFYLAEFHFHEAAEHWINDHQYPMELHIVFQNGAGRAVLGFMINYTKRGKANNLVDPRAVQKAILNDGQIHIDELAKCIELNPADWLPDEKGMKTYYRYEGSLTTPEFDENVSWLLFKKPITLKKDEVDVLRHFFGLPARIPQPANRRYVLGTK